MFDWVLLIAGLGVLAGFLFLEILAAIAKWVKSRRLDKTKEYGIRIEAALECQITGCYCTGEAGGIELNAGDDCRVEGCYFLPERLGWFRRFWRLLVGWLRRFWKLLKRS